MKSRKSPASNKKSKKEEELSENLPDEVTSLILLAADRQIDILVWLSEDGENLDAAEFVNKLRTLSLIAGLDGDEATKLIVDAATSEKSVKTIIRLCGNPIDIPIFMEKCGAEVGKYGSSSQGGNAASRIPVDLRDAAELHLQGIDTGTFTPGDRGGNMMDRFSDMYFDEQKSANQYNRTPSEAMPSASEAEGTSVAATALSSVTATKSSPIKHKPAAAKSPSTLQSSSLTKPQATRTTTASAPKQHPAAATRQSRPASATPRTRSTATAFSSSGTTHVTASATTADRRRTLRESPAATARSSSASHMRSSGDSAALMAPPRGATSPERNQRIDRIVAARTRSYTPSTASLFIDLQARESAPFVEESIRGVVRQADLYHISQVHLGFVSEGYTMVPARGVIVASKPREWLSVRDIQNAFEAGRLRMSETQAISLGQLVYTFSLEYKKNHSNIPINDETLEGGSSDEAKEQTLNQSRFAPLNIVPLPSSALAPSHTLSPKQKMMINAEWLRMYLVQLRINAPKLRRSLAIASSVVSLPETGAEGEDLRASHEQKPPMPWLDWLGTKLAHDQKDAAGKARGFRKALSGGRHDLSKDEINHLLQNNSIIPNATMDEEIAYRVKCWVLDMSGRRESFFTVERKMKEWETQRKRELKQAQQLQPGEQPRPVRISDGEMEEARAAIREACIATKTAALRQSEQDDAALTKELFWKYDATLHEGSAPGAAKSHALGGAGAGAGPLGPPPKAMTWGDWLSRHREDCDKQLEKFQKMEKIRARAVADRVSRKYLMASLSDIEANVEKLLSSRDLNKTLKTAADKGRFEMEWKKSLLALRKCAMQRAATGAGAGKGAMVSRAEFDAHLNDVLAPHLKDLPEHLRRLAKDIHRSYRELLEKHGFAEAVGPGSGQEAAAVGAAAAGAAAAGAGAATSDKENEVFQTDREAIERRVLAHRDEKSAAAKAAFEEWERDKLAARKVHVDSAREALKAEAKEKADKKSKADKAYKKWIRLQSKGEYVSHLDGKKKNLKKPALKVVVHPAGWSKGTAPRLVVTNSTIIVFFIIFSIMPCFLTT